MPRPVPGARVHDVATTKIPTGSNLLDLLKSDDLLLRLRYSASDYEWCTDFLAMLIWFASMFEEHFVFRGHSTARWNLQPKIVRVSLGPKPPQTFEELVTAERRIVDEVRRARWASLRDEFTPEQYVDFIALLQHRGVATRLIDVTADPLVAAFFAAEDDKRNGAVLSILRKEFQLAKVSTTPDPVQFLPGSGAYTVWTPPPIDLRMIAQRGEFLLVNGSQETDLTGPLLMKGVRPRGKAKYHLERIAEGYFISGTKGRRVEQPPTVAMFYLPRKFKSEMRAVLSSLGVNRRTLFPDLQGYADLFRP